MGLHQSQDGFGGFAGQATSSGRDEGQPGGAGGLPTFSYQRTSPRIELRTTSGSPSWSQSATLSVV